MQALNVLPLCRLCKDANLKAIERHRNVRSVLAALEVDASRSWCTGDGYGDVLVGFELDIRIIADNRRIKYKVIPQPVIRAVVYTALEGAAGACDGERTGKPVARHGHAPQALPVERWVIVELTLKPFAMDGVCDPAVKGRPGFFGRPAQQLHGNGALFVVWPAVQRTGQVEQRIRAWHLYQVLVHLRAADLRAAHFEVQTPVREGMIIADFCALQFCHYTPLAFLVTVTPMRASTFCAILGEMTPTSSPESMTT